MHPPNSVKMLTTVHHHQLVLLLHRSPHFILSSKPLHSFTPKCLFSSSIATKPLTQPPTTNLPTSQILSIRHSLLTRQLTAVEIAESYLTRLRIAEPKLRSFLHIADEESILRQAEEIDRKIERNEEVGLLGGVLVGVKDNICTSDMPSTAGSKILDGYRPPFDATAGKKVKELGGIIVGKTNLDEFGMGSTTEGSAFQEKLWTIHVLRRKIIHKESTDIEEKKKRGGF